jgi:AcrR family transcriptional regulator
VSRWTRAIADPTYAHGVLTLQRPRGLALRDAIIAAASRILERSGNPDDITIRSIAAEAGISQPAVYLHFQSRDELVHEVAFGVFRQHQAALDEMLADVEDALERIARRADAYLEFALAQPGVFHALLMGSGRERDPDRFEGYDDAAKAGLGKAIADVQAAMAAGQIERRDPATVALVLWTGVHGLAALMLSLPGFPWPQRHALLRSVVNAQLAALAAPAQPTRGW